MGLMVGRTTLRKQIRVQRLQNKNNMVGSSFHTGTNSFKESSLSRELWCAHLRIKRSFQNRHDGDLSLTRECIKEYIEHYREVCLKVENKNAKKGDQLKLFAI